MNSPRNSFHLKWPIPLLALIVRKIFSSCFDCHLTISTHWLTSSIPASYCSPPLLSSSSLTAHRHSSPSDCTPPSLSLPQISFYPLCLICWAKKGKGQKADRKKNMISVMPTWPSSLYIAPAHLSLCWCLMHLACSLWIPMHAAQFSRVPFSMFNQCSGG